jgi:hypothetical protein
MSVMFKICEAVGLLDMIAAFSQLVTVNDYTRPQLTDTLAIQAARHPIKEKIMSTKFVHTTEALPNHYWLQYEWQEHLHPYRRPHVHHGSDWILVR